MKIALSDAPLASLTADAIAIGATSADDLSALDQAFGGQLTDHVAAQTFTFKAGTTLAVPGLGHIGARTLIIAGLGDGSHADLLAAAGAIGRAARKGRAEHLAVALGALGDSAGPVVEAIAAGNYSFDRYKKESARSPAVHTLTLVGSGVPDASDLHAATVRAEAQAFARDLVNLPPADLYPQTLAEAAQTLGAIDGVTVTVKDFETCKAEGLVGVVAVGQGSAKPGCVIHVQYAPANPAAHIALVGKGVTFDSGGLSLKPSSGMQTMRCDMGGAATMLAATKAIAALGLPVAVDTFIGAVENMNDGNSYKLGDILTYNNGVTVEIHNTDAEGRLVLADCLILASETDAATIVDAATLTGACAIALGPDFTGLFTKDDALAAELSAAATANGEGLWRLPLHDPYAKMLESSWAQIKNVGGREAGATTAALFLQHFVGEGKRWAHLDIAPSAFVDKPNKHYEAGATGEMVRSLVTWAAGLA